MAVASPPPSLPLPMTNHCCPNCGYGLAPPTVDDPHAALLSAQKRIADLEAQVQLLNQKATAAVDRWADYEDELSRLRALQSPTTTATTSVASPTSSSFLPVGAANRISALLSRKSTPNLRTNNPQASVPQTPQTPQHQQLQLGPTRSNSSGAHPSSPLASPTPSAATAEDLIEALSREQNLRKEAESRLSTTSKEVEELSVALFEQANEMVATERKARARLEERVEVLEKREVDKKRRLERLESAMGRIERVRSLLGDEAMSRASGRGNRASAPSPLGQVSGTVDEKNEKEGDEENVRPVLEEKRSW